MIQAAEQNNVKLMIAYRLHFEKGNLDAINVAQSGKLGELRYFTSESPAGGRREYTSNLSS